MRLAPPSGLALQISLIKAQNFNLSDALLADVYIARRSRLPAFF
jgi:hypothetical protein